jgi:hypothetical protein
MISYNDRIILDNRFAYYLDAEGVIFCYECGYDQAEQLDRIENNAGPQPIKCSICGYDVPHVDRH